MPGKEYWRFQNAMGEFEGLYQPNQSLATSIAQLNDKFPTKLGNVDLLLEGIRVVFPGYTITPQERAEAPRRREISAQARMSLFTLLHNRQQEYSLNQTGLTLERGIDMLFDCSGSTNAKEWNDQVRFLFSKEGSSYPNGTKEARGKMMSQFIDRLLQTDFDRLYHISDRELAEEFDQMYPLLTFLSEGGDGLLKLEGNVFSLPDGYVDKVKELKASHQTLLTSLRARFEYIARPEYEIIPYERMRLPRGRDFDFYNADDTAEKTLEERIKEDSQADLFFDCAFRQHEMFTPSVLDRVNHEIRKLNLPEELLNPPVYDNQGNRIPAPLLNLSLPDGTALSENDLYPGQTICFTNPISKQQNLLWSDGKSYTTIDFSHMPDPLKTDAEKALRELEDADPWRIRAFTGSKEYNEMKAAMKNVAEFMQKIPKSPTKEQRDEFKLLLEDLEEKQAAYATHKGELSASTKDSERARINASNIVKKYIDDASVLMDGYEKAVAVRENMHETMKNARDNAMGKQMDAENNYQRPRNITNAREEVQYSEKVSVAYGKNLPFGDPLKDLGDDIYMNGYSDKTPDVLNTIAKMVTYDLIARERVGKKEAGPVERAYLAGPDTFIQGLENSQTLQKIAASVEQNGELKNFMNSTVGKNVQTLSDTVIEESKGRQKTAPDPLMYPTQMMRNVIDAQAPVAPKRGPMGK